MISSNNFFEAKILMIYAYTFTSFARLTKDNYLNKANCQYPSYLQLKIFM